MLLLALASKACDVCVLRNYVCVVSSFVPDKPPAASTFGAFEPL